MPTCRNLAIAAVLSALLSAAPLSARPGGWGRPMPVRAEPATAGRHESREGKVEVNVFFAEDLAPGTLGQGTVAVRTLARDGEALPHDAAVFEAAAIDRLAAAGYQTAVTASGAGQAVELRIARTEIVPEEAPHKPVSGEMTMGMSNRGSMMGMAIAVDLTKPKAALVSTRLEARLRDSATGKVLWEGRADIATRAGDPQWGAQEVSAKLAAALFATLRSAPGGHAETF